MKGFVKKKTTRIVGIITVLMVALVIGIVTAVATSSTPTAKAAGSALRVAIFCDDSTNPADTASTFRAVQACGFDIYGIGRDDIEQGRLTTKKYDVLLLPAGASDDRIWYYNTAFGFSANMKQQVQNFAAAGGGVVGIEGGASFMCADVGNPAHSLNIYGGSYTPDYVIPPGKNTLTYTDPSFGTGTQELYRSYGTGPIASYTSTGPTDPYGTSTTVATTAEDGNVIERATYGTGANPGHVVVCSLLPDLRGDSTLDWTIWDNWVMGGTQTNSVGGWSLLGRMINWAGTGTATAPTITEYANPTGRKVGILASLEYWGTGGVYPAYLPSLFRAVAAAGDVPLAVRASEINGVFKSNLTTANFDAFILPEAWYGAAGVGNTAEAKDIGAAGAAAIQSFAASGGGVMGIGEESAAFLSADYWTEYYGDWNNCYFTNPATLFNGSTIYYDDAYGLQTGITTASDPSVIGNVDGGASVQTWTYDWPCFYGLDFDDISSYGTPVSTYDYDGEVANVRCMYGAGHVFLAGPDNAILSGSNYDWTTWDNYVWGTGNPGTKLTNPDIPKPWDVIKAALNHWVCCPTPTVASSAPSSWKSAPVTVNLAAADGNGPGIDTIQYRLAGTTDWTDGTSFVVSADGVNNYEFRALDMAGNSSAIGTCSVKIDTTVPTATDDAPAGWSDSDVTVTITGHDTSSSMGKIQYRLSTPADPTWHDTTRTGDYTGQFVVSATDNDGVHVYRYRVIDLAGHISTSGICTVRINTL